VSLFTRKKKINWSKIEEGVRVIAKYKGEEVGGVFLMNPGGADRTALHINLDNDSAKYRKIEAKNVTIDQGGVITNRIKVPVEKHFPKASPLKAIVPDRPDMKIRVGSRVWVSLRNTTLPGIVNKIKSKGRYFCVDVEGDDLPNRSFTRDEIVRVLS